MRPPPPALQTTTLWDFPSQHYGVGDGPEAVSRQGSSAYRGATPAGVVWNLLRRYTRPKDLVVDPMAGSGTTLDVARDLGRRALGYDLVLTRPDVFRADARRLPLEDAKADFVFADPPYSTHLDYSDDPRCIGKLDAADPAYYDAMARVFAEWDRILRPDRYVALYVGDSQVPGRGFHPIGLELFARLRARFTPVDVVAVARHNRTLAMGNYRKAAEEGNFFLRGFHYLFVAYKPPAAGQRPRPVGPALDAESGGEPGPRGRAPSPGPATAGKTRRAAPPRRPAPPRRGSAPKPKPRRHS